MFANTRRLEKNTLFHLFKCLQSFSIPFFESIEEFENVIIDFRNKIFFVRNVITLSYNYHSDLHWKDEFAAFITMLLDIRCKSLLIIYKHETKCIYLMDIREKITFPDFIKIMAPKMEPNFTIYSVNMSEYPEEKYPQFKLLEQKLKTYFKGIYYSKNVRNTSLRHILIYTCSYENKIYKCEKIRHYNQRNGFLLASRFKNGNYFHVIKLIVEFL